MSSTAIAQTYPLTELGARKRFDNHDHTTTFSTDLEEGESDPSIHHQYQVHKSFQILKTARLLFLGPSQHLVLMPTGGTSTTSSPSYHTSALIWCRGLYLPPSFSVYLRAMLPKKRGQGERAPACIGRVCYKGFEGVFTLHFVVEIFRAQEDGSEGELLKGFDVRREGVGRTYSVGRKEGRVGGETAFENGIIWRGLSKKKLNALDVHHPDTHDHSVQTDTWIGNLEMVRESQPDKVLAVFKNVGFGMHMKLGDLLLLEDFNEGEGLEEVLLAALGLVAAERMSKRGGA